jgi:hypothetical protein
LLGITVAGPRYGKGLPSIDADRLDVGDFRPRRKSADARLTLDVGSQLILRPWLAFSVLWIAGVFFFESLDGQLTYELGQVFAIALLPPILPRVALVGLVWVISDMFRP